jgi:C-terminal processing protease CtpA/Prc
MHVLITIICLVCVILYYAKAEITRDSFGYTVPFNLGKKSGLPTNIDPPDHQLNNQMEGDIAKAQAISMDDVVVTSNDMYQQPTTVYMPEKDSMPPTLSNESLSIPVAKPNKRVSIYNIEPSQKADKLLGRNKHDIALSRRDSLLFTLESHIVTVKSQHTKNIHIRSSPTATCQELNSAIIEKLDILEPDTFGLAVIIDGEYIFLEPDVLLYKYAPSGWKSWKPGSKHQCKEFIVHFRVMYHPTNVNVLRENQTRYIHFLQVLEDILYGIITVSKDQSLILAGLALQAIWGYDKTRLPLYENIIKDYLPNYIIEEMAEEDVPGTLRRLHYQQSSLSRNQAEFYYLKEASNLDEYGHIYYTVSTTKDNDDFLLLGFSCKGLRVCRLINDVKETSLLCPWKTTDSIEFKNRKVHLRVTGKAPMTLYAIDHKRAQYFIKLSQKYHYFDRKYRNFTFVEESLEKENVYNVLDYHGEFMTVTLLKDLIGLGITIRHHATSLQTFAEIEAIKENGPAHKDGRLKIGDLLIEANGIRLINEPHKQIGSILSETAPQVNLIVFRRRDVNDTGQQNNDMIVNITSEMSGNNELSFDQADGSMPLEDHSSPFRKSSELTLIAESTIVDDSGIARPLSSISEVKTVKLLKKNKSFGFAISGSQRNPYRCVSITKITPTGAADECGELNIGDNIISVNGISSEGKSYQEVFDMLKGSGDELSLQVCPPDDDSHITVTIERKQMGPLGIRIKENEGRIEVSKIVKGTDAYANGMITAGDELIEVNGENLRGLSLREASEILLKQKDFFKINFYIRRKEKPPAEKEHIYSVPKSRQVQDVERYYFFSITLCKSRKGFGFKVRNDPPHERVNKGLYVASVDYDPALSDGRLQSGDELIEFNGHDMIGILREEGIKLMRSSGDEGNMMFRRRISKDRENTAEPVYVNVARNGGLDDDREEKVTEEVKINIVNEDGNKVEEIELQTLHHIKERDDDMSKPENNDIDRNTNSSEDNIPPLPNSSPPLSRPTSLIEPI